MEIETYSEDERRSSIFNCFTGATPAKGGKRKEALNYEAGNLGSILGVLV